MLAAQGPLQSFAVHLAVLGCGQFCKEAEKDRPTRASGSTRFYLAYNFTENQRILELCAGGDDLEEHRRARNKSGWECNQHIPTEELISRDI